MQRWNVSDKYQKRDLYVLVFKKVIFLSRVVPRVRFVLNSKNEHWSKRSEGGVFWILYIKRGTRKTSRAR